MDVDKLQADAATIDWSAIENVNLIDDKVSLLNSNIISLFDKHAPIRRIKIKHPPAPWMDNIIRKAMARRDRAFRNYKRDRSDSNWSEYKTKRNLCNKLVRNAKRKYITKQIELSSPAGLWNFLRSLGVSKPKTTDALTSIDLNTLNAHFSVTPKLNNSQKSISLSQIKSLPVANCDSFVFSMVSEDRVRQTMSSLKTKAVGCDNVGRIMLMHILNHILPIVTHIINYSLTSGDFPDLWRKAHVLPLPKISNPSLLKHYRPISILPFLSKVIESVVHRQITEFLTKASLFNNFQSGFRAGHSTTTALLKVTEDIRANMEKKEITVLVLIDFSNAFNAVDHDLLLAFLPRLNFSAVSVSWFSSYLQGRRQAVRSGQSISDWHSVEAGVPQGGILSPLLFSLFINLLSPSIKSNYHMYADDLQLYRSSSTDDLGTTIAALNEDLLRLHNWSEGYGISVNAAKCQAILIGSSHQLLKVDHSILPVLSYNECTIPFSSSIKDLGLIIDPYLTWSEHVKEISRKFFSSLHSIIRLKHFLPIKTKISLVNALLLPIIDYADVCFVNLNADLLNKLDRLLNACIKFIFCLRKYDHVSEYRSKLKWLTIRERRSIRILCTLYTILNDPKIPTYLKELFMYLSDSHERQLRSTFNPLLSTPQHSSSFMTKSFSVTAVKLWNDLPVDIRKIPSKFLFKQKLREHFLKKRL